MGVRLIIGVGTGRCGTKSLAAFLSSSERVTVTHEQGPFLPWKPGEEDVEVAIEFMEAMEGKARKHGCTHVGDVAANWLPYVPVLREHFGERLTVLGTWRERAAVVGSFIQHMPDACTRNRTLGEKQFPTYDLPPKFALEKYWDLYRRRTEKLGIELFHVSSLNSRVGQRAILDHVGIPKQSRILVTHHLNG